MPRQARLKGEFSIYHVIQRGNEKKYLFFSDDDRVRFLDTLRKMKKKYNFLLYAYCLMDNHVHLLIDDNGNDISKIVASINISYAQYFNRTFKRCGHLFQDRFRSEWIDNDQYLLGVSRYIHNNPVKAGIVKEPCQYDWSSYNVYIGKERDKNGIVDSSRILRSFSSNQAHATNEYINYVNNEEDNHITFMDVDVDEFLPDEFHNRNFIISMEQARLKIKKVAEDRKVSPEILINQTEIRNKLIKQMRSNSSLTLKQIGELFGGISESRVSRIAGKG